MLRILLANFFLTAALVCAADGPARPKLDLRDDAALHDVQFIGRSGWACGDRGAFWRTEDAGESWQIVAVPVDCSLNSLCFLTDRIGWMAGGEITPWTRSENGIVLYTSDGGLNWTPIESRSLPALHHIQFFSLEDGVCVGSRASQFGTGLFRTADGGRTWEEMTGPFDRPWRAAAFATPTLGVLAGGQGSLAVWGGDDLRTSQLTTLGTIPLRGVSLDHEFAGWLVGDAATLYRTRLGGTVWEKPAGDLTTPLRDGFDFQCVAHLGTSVWVAGRPGTVIWHSPDDGQTWQAQPTGQSVPIHALHFSDSQNGFAVGALGQILKTDNGGQRWRTVRGKDRRAALLVITARPQSVPFSAITQLSEELGFRTHVVIPVLDETGQTTRDPGRLDLNLRAATLSAGAGEGEIRTRLPIGVPDAQTDRERLLQEWTRRTDGRLAEILFTELISQIRSWRPDVILIDRAAADDQTAELLNLAILQAVEQADDPTRVPVLAEAAALAPWSVKRVYERTAAGETGSWRLRTQSFLPHVGATLSDETRESLSFLTQDSIDVPPIESFRIVVQRDTRPVPSSGDPFSGLSIPPDSPSRRALSPIDESMLASADQTRVREQFLAVHSATLSDGLDPARNVALLDGHLRKLTPDEAARDLLRMSRQHLAHAAWDSAEALLIELVNRYPHQPAGQAGMTELMMLWSSEEIFWQRSRAVGTPERIVQVNPLQVHKLLQEPIDRTTSSQIYRPPAAPREVSPATILQVSDEFEDLNGARMRGAAAERWRQQAGMLGVALWVKNPSLFRQSDLQLGLASAARSPDVARRMEDMIREFDPQGFGPGMTLANWLQPPRMPTQPALAEAFATPARPQLDGVLSDECWKEARALPLGRDSDERKSRSTALTMIAWDAEFLYLAASCQKAPGVTMLGPETAGRTHDRDVSGRDRITFAFDIDRDFATYYELTIDERGWTQERCCGHPFWNPEMFIAVDADDTHWRIEAAIRLSDLSPGTIGPGQGWGLAVSRSIPGEGWQNFAGESQNIRPQLDNFGIVRFEGQSGN